MATAKVDVVTNSSGNANKNLSLVSASLNSITKAAASVSTGVKNASIAFTQMGASSSKNSSATTNGILASNRAALSFISTLAQLKTVSDIISVSTSFESIRYALDDVTGSSKESAKQLEYLRQLTDRVGASFIDVSNQFVNMQAAAKGTSFTVEQTNRIFSLVVEKMSILGKGTEDTRGALVALQQIMSKGVVSAEEVRQQLGERLPGALQLSAKAVGVTVAQFGKMLEQGQVLSEDFLPKFADQLEKSMANSGQRVETLRATIERMRNEWQLLLEQIGRSTFINQLTDGLKLLSAGYRQFNDELKRLSSETGSYLEATASNIKIVSDAIKVVTGILSAGIGVIIIGFRELGIVLARTAEKISSLFGKDISAEVSAFIDDQFTLIDEKYVDIAASGLRVKNSIKGIADELVNTANETKNISTSWLDEYINKIPKIIQLRSQIATIEELTKKLEETKNKLKELSAENENFGVKTNERLALMRQEIELNNRLAEKIKAVTGVYPLAEKGISTLSAATKELIDRKKELSDLIDKEKEKLKEQAEYEQIIFQSKDKSLKLADSIVKQNEEENASLQRVIESLNNYIESTKKSGDELKNNINSTKENSATQIEHEKRIASVTSVVDASVKKYQEQIKAKQALIEKNKAEIADAQKIKSDIENLNISVEEGNKKLAEKVKATNASGDSVKQFTSKTKDASDALLYAAGAIRDSTGTLREMTAEEKAAADAKQKTAEKTKESADAEVASNERRKDSVESYTDLLRKRKEEADKLQAEEDKKFTSTGATISKLVESIRTGLGALSEQTLAYYDKLTTTGGAMASTLTSAEESLRSVNRQIGANSLDAIEANSSMQGLARTIYVALDAKRQFFEEAVMADNLERSIGNVSTLTLRGVNSIYAAVDGFKFLDKTRLDSLRSQIDSVRQKMAGLRDEVNSTIRNLKDSIDQLRGNEKQIEERRFKAEKDRLNELLKNADIENKRKIEEALRLLDEEHRIKLKNIADEEKQRAEQQREYEDQARQRKKELDDTTKTETRPTATAGDIIQSNPKPSDSIVPIGGQPFVVQFNVNGSDLLSERQVRDKIIPIIENVFRRKA